MNIALDYDNTFTRDPDFWLNFVLLCKNRGHKIYCVTARSQQQAAEVFQELGQYIGEDCCFFTNMRAKRSYMFKQGISIDVWIDDQPDFIIHGVDDDVAPAGIII